MLRVLLTNDRSTVTGPAIFFDRDGVINCRRAGDYVLNWTQFVFMPGMRRTLSELSTLQLPMIIISNQSAVGRGLLTSISLQEITTQMHRTLLDDGICFTAAYFCTHTPEEGCLCRKPKPGLLHAAAADFNIDLKRSILIGDSDTDVQAAQAAGCQPLLFGRGISSSASTLDWVTGLPVALTPDDLFGVAVDSLRAIEGAKSSDGTAQD